MVVLLRGGFMDYTIEMRSGAVIYPPSFMKICSAIQNLIGGYTYRHGHAESKVIS